MPRRMKTEPEKELIHLLPIKDKGGIIPQTMEKPGKSWVLESVFTKYSKYLLQKSKYLFFSEFHSVYHMLDHRHSVFAVLNVEEDEEEEDAEETEVAEGNKASYLFIYFFARSLPVHCCSQRKFVI